MKKILLMGGGEFHDYEGCTEVIARYLEEWKEEYTVERVIQDLSYLERPKLDEYDLVIFYWTKDHLTPAQKHGLLDWMAEKGKFVAVHCAATAFRDCPEYESMLGGRFKKHPPYRNYFVSLDMEHPAMRKHFENFEVPAEWTNWSVHECLVKDEQFLIHYDRRVNVAATAAFNGRVWPVAWSRAWGNGKLFYLALGHDVEACSTEFFKQMLFAGIRHVEDPAEEPSWSLDSMFNPPPKTLSQG